MRTACIWIPRGNAKTTLASALALAHFMGPEAEAGGQVIQAAADRENAGIAFKHSWEMVRQDRALLARVAPIESRKTLNHPGTASVLKAISTEAYTKHGLNVSFFLADEVHAWPATEARKLFKVVTDSMVKRDQPLTVAISTAGEGTGGLASDLWEYSHKVYRTPLKSGSTFQIRACGKKRKYTSSPGFSRRRGIASGEIEDPTFAPIIFAAPAGADWRDESAWHSANPAVAAGFYSLEELRIKARRIEHFPAEIADFKRFHLNMWQEGAAEPWLALEVYDAAEPMVPVDDLEGRPCWVGVDLSSVEDLTAVVAVFPSTGDDGHARYDVLPMFFLPEAGLARKAERDRADYLRWKEAGFLTVTAGNVVDHGAIIAHVVGLGERYGVQEVAIDRWNSTAVNTALQEAGFIINQFGQGFASMAAPVKELKRAILAGHFRHGANPILRMCFGNVVAEKDAAENEKFIKDKARGRIDGAVAAAMAIGRILANDTGTSIYDSEAWTPDMMVM